MNQRVHGGTAFSIAAAIFTLILFAGVITFVGIHVPGSSELDAQTQLMRPDSGTAPDAKGTLSIRTNTENGTHSFEVYAQNIDGLAPHELWVEYPLLPGTFLFIALMESDDDDRAEYTVDTKNGDALPHGAASISDLAGLGVEVRRDAVSILNGTIPTPE